MKNLQEEVLSGKFLYTQLNQEHQVIVNECLGWLEKYWDAPPLVDFYTDHGRGHCLRLVEIADEFSWILQKLSEQECFILLMGLLLHDIGMQADIRKFSSVRRYMKDTYQIRFVEGDLVTRPSQELQNQIRRNHHLLTEAMLLLMYRNELSELPTNDQLILGNEGRRVNEEEMQNIKDICKYHSKLDIRELPKDRQGRVRLLAALLRLFDELDITDKRVSMLFPAFHAVPLENVQYWDIHQHTRWKINKDEHAIIMRVYLTAHDYARYKVIFWELLSQLKEKNRDVLDIIGENSTLIFNVNEDCVAILDTVKDFSEETMELILSTFSSDRERFGILLSAAVKKLPKEKKNQLFRLTLRHGTRLPQPPAPVSLFIQELLSNQLLTERRNGERHLRPQLLEIVYPLVKEELDAALQSNNLEELSKLPLLDAELPLTYRRMQHQIIIAPLLKKYQSNERKLKKNLWNLLNQVRAEEDNRSAARNLVVLLMAAGYDFKGTNLSDLDLSRVDFSWAGPEREGYKIVLQDVSLQNARLKGARFTEKMDLIRSCIFIDQNHFATGDSLGEVCVWSLEPLEILCRTAEHRCSVWGLVYHSQSRRLFSCAHDGKVVSYSLDEGATALQPLTLLQKETWLACLDCHGDLIATSGCDGNIYFVNFQTGGHFSYTATCGKVTYHSIRFDHSGKFLLAGDNLGGVLLLKLNTERNGVEEAHSCPNISTEAIRSIETHPQRNLFYIPVLREVMIAEIEESPALRLKIRDSVLADGNDIKKLVLFANGTRLLSTSKTQQDQLWNLDDPIQPKKEQQFQMKDMYSFIVAVSPDERFMLGAVRDSAALRLWDLQRAEELQIICGCQSWLSSLCFFQSGTRFVTGSSSGHVGLWSYKKMGEVVNVQNLYCHPYAVNPIAISTDDRYLISGSSSGRGEIYIWDTQAECIAHILPRKMNKGLRSLVFLDSWMGLYRFVSAGFDNKVRLWTFDPVKKQCTQEILSTSFPGFLGSCAVSGNKELLAFSVLTKSAEKFVSEGELPNYEFHDICVISLKNGNTSKTIYHPVDRIQTLAFTPDGSLLVCGDTKGLLHFIKMNHPEESKCVQVTREHIGCVAFSSSGDLLACADGSGTVTLWDPEERTQLSSHQIPSGLQLHTIAFAPDDQAVLTSGMDGRVYVFPISDRKLGTFSAHPCIYPYEGLCLKGTTGLSSQRRAALELLGAKEE